jgi:single-stranded DNA-binding protein
MNSVTLSGQLGRDVTLEEHGGILVARLEIGTVSTFRDPAGKRHERLDCHRVTLCDSLARDARELRQGDRVTVQGALRTCLFEIDGREVLGVEIVASRIESQPETCAPASEEVSPLHPVDDGFLFFQLAQALLFSAWEVAA